MKTKQPSHKFPLNSKIDLMFRRQFQICSLALVAALICSNSAYAQFISHSNDSNTTTIGIGPMSSIVFFAEGTTNLPAVDSLDISVPVGSFFYGVVSPPPPVLNISGLGIFSGASTVFTAGPDAEASFSLPSGAFLTENSPIAEVFFDTSGLSDGDSIEYGITGSFFSGGTEFETVNVLTFFANVEAVPEPSSAGLLLALGSIAMMRRKRV